jgi:regulator of protease activity HflC (stomatin/prohibitin superfamily)
MKVRLLPPALPTNTQTKEHQMVDIDNTTLARLREDAESYRSVRRWINLACKITAGLVVGIFLLTLVSKAVGPQLNLYRANTEKQAVIAEQKAQSEAAEFAARSAVTQAEAKAQAMIIEAKALAESQDIIAKTLTPEYIRYLYIKAIENNPNQVIYVPTEAGMPILESGRAVTTTTTP